MELSRSERCHNGAAAEFSRTALTESCNGELYWSRICNGAVAESCNRAVRESCNREIQRSCIRNGAAAELESCSRAVKLV